MGNFQCPCTNKPVTLGYYPIRGKVQVIRMLCQYLHVNYKDLLLSPDEWEKYKQNQAKEWVIKDMPFLIDGTFHVTGVAGCLYYIVEKSKRTDMFGKNAEDFIKIWSMRNKKDVLHGLIGLGCNTRSGDPMEQSQKMNKCWREKMEPLIAKLEKDAKQDDWYLGYISILDFFLYQVVNQIEYNFSNQLCKFPKLRALRQRVSRIPEIENYEKSKKCQKECCPKKYFDKYKSQMSELSENTKNSSQGQMDVE